LTGVTLPDGLATIGGWAFEYCAGLTNITIPATVTSIGYSAFSDCGLTTAYFKGNAPALGYHAFYDSGNPTIFCLPGASGWGATYGGCPTVVWRPQALTRDVAFGVRSNQFGFNISGASGMMVVVEAADTLANPVWIPVATKTLSSEGSAYFRDLQWGISPNRFYRFCMP
jgi:hypothetical protein